MSPHECAIEKPFCIQPMCSNSLTGGVGHDGFPHHVQFRLFFGKHPYACVTLPTAGTFKHRYNIVSVKGFRSVPLDRAFLN